MFKRILKLFKRKPRIGRSEKVSLPEFGISTIDAKIDTGAYRGAIHCKKIVFLERNGKKYVSFRLLDDSHPEYQEKDIVAHDYKIVQVTSSNGSTEDRVVIKTEIIIAGHSIQAELTLADREAMTFPLLIGRKSIKRFLIDPSLKNI
ncbi:hypothetical protein GW765_00570 [Candidatus Parcubacteria bacterium]|nr:hypothetical protein [Candidatus Parcubacteria bacterium]